MILGTQRYPNWDILLGEKDLKRKKTTSTTKGIFWSFHPMIPDNLPHDSQQSSHRRESPLSHLLLINSKQLG